MKLRKHILLGVGGKKEETTQNIVLSEAGNKTEYTFLAIGPGHLLI